MKPTARTLTADTTGPVTIDAELLRHAGTITVRAEADCERATVTISTDDHDGPAVDAVLDALLRQSKGRLTARVQGQGTGGNTTVVTGTSGGTTVIQSFGTVHAVTAINLGSNMVTGDGVWTNEVRVDGNSGGVTVVKGSSPITVTAVVPEGSSVEARSDIADIDALGALLTVTADTQSGSLRTGHVAKVRAHSQSGSVRVDQAVDIQAKTMSGSILLGRTDIVSATTLSGSINVADFGGTALLNTMSGSITVHATAGGDISAKTMSGSIDVTATQAALDGDLDVRASSMSGQVNTPRRRTDGGLRRRR